MYVLPSQPLPRPRSHSPHLTPPHPTPPHPTPPHPTPPVPILARAALSADIGDEFRFRVRDVTYPARPTPAAIHALRESGRVDAVGMEANPYAPMVVHGEANGDGLGCLRWWDVEED